MQKLVSFDVQEIAFAPEDVAAALNKACSARQGRYRVSGLCQLDNTVLFVLLPLEGAQPLEEYQFSTVSDLTVAGFTEELLGRWARGLNALGAVAVGDTRVLLLARPRGRPA